MLHFVNLVRCLQLSSRYPDPEQTPEFEVSDSGIISLTSDLGERDFAERDMKWMGKSRPTVQEQISIARQRNSKATRLCVLEGIPKQMPNIIFTLGMFRYHPWTRRIVSPLPGWTSGTFGGALDSFLIFPSAISEFARLQADYAKPAKSSHVIVRQLPVVCLSFGSQHDRHVLDCW